MIILSHIQLSAIEKPISAIEISISPDLNRSYLKVVLSPEGLSFPSGEVLDWQNIEKIKADKNGCFLVVNNQAEKIQAFSDRTGYLYSLMPTSAAPTMLISGIPMHRIKDTDPWQDTQAKIKAMGKIFGPLLDTNTGLGYTAIAASKYTSKVFTIEIEPTALDICQKNPWSAGLFNSHNITSIIGDSFDIVQGVPDEYFNQVLHDPPTFALAGHLYSQEFYANIFRILKPGGRLFHYIGNPESKTGSSMTGGVINRLRLAGFENIIPKQAAFGLLATKR